MAETFTKSDTPRRLSDLLAEPRHLDVRESLRLIQRLALHVDSLHRSGSTHRAIDAGEIGIDEKLLPQLGPAPATRRFGDGDSDPEFCPPELANADSLLLPENIEEAASLLEEQGHRLDPRRIDVYQLGVLLCRLLTGEAMLAYMYDPKVKADVPAMAQEILGRALGDHAAGPYEDCGQFLAALEEVVGEAEPVDAPTSMYETPAQGSLVLVDADTPPRGNQSASAPSTPEAAGDLPFERLGQYRILGRIGSGGMGDVYRGYDESLERPVAVKVLPPELARQEDYVRRFQAEATAAAKLSHANVVPVYSIGEDAGHHFFAMEFIEGGTLSDRLKQERSLPLQQTLRIVEQCLAGLQAAHGHGLIHRDIKPGNILLDRASDRAVLVDFGLVRRLGQSTQMTATGMVMGTVDYIAPEQARGRKVDGRADIYSLGVLMYQMLAGRLPFEAGTPTAMIFQHAYEEPFPLTDAVPEMPQPVVEIIARMMAKEPADRYADCEAVLADIEAFREDRPLAAVEAKSGTRATTILPAPDPSWELELPKGLAELADNRGLRRARDWAATMFRRHAPEFVKELQSTTQQVDGAVSHCERHRERLANLQAEARGVADELAEQLQSNVEAAAAALQEVEAATDDEQEQAALAKKRECEEHIEALRTQHDEQQRQVEEIEHRLIRTDGKLAQLRSQRDALKARLKAAEARQQFEGGHPRARRPRWVLPAAIAGVLTAVAVVVSLLLYVAEDKRVPKTVADAPTELSPSGRQRHQLVFTFDDEAFAEQYWQWSGEWDMADDGGKAPKGPRSYLRTRHAYQGDLSIDMDFSFGRAAYTNTGNCWITVWGEKLPININHRWHRLSAKIHIHREGDEIVFVNNGEQKRIPLEANVASKPTVIEVRWRSRSSHFRRIEIKGENVSGTVPDMRETPKPKTTRQEMALSVQENWPV